LKILEKIDLKIRSLILRYKPKKNFKLAVIVKACYFFFNSYKILFFIGIKKKHQKKILESSNINELKKNGSLQIELKDLFLDKILNQYINLLNNNQFNSNKSFLKTYRIDIREKDNQLYLSILFENNLLDLVKSYLGDYCTLQNVMFMHSENNSFEANRSQQLHIDGDVADQIKIFIHLSDVDNNSGPLCGFSKNDSKIIFKNAMNKKYLNYISAKLSDEMIDQKIFDDRLVKFTGSKKTATLLDTSRCFHYGSRPGAKPRYILMYQFLKSYSYRVRMFPNKNINLDENAFRFDQIDEIKRFTKFTDYFPVNQNNKIY